MATYTSTQSGNFSNAATWGGGGAPSAEGDVFNITAGHTVTIDTGVSNPTNGFADSNIYGILQSQSGQSNTLRMNGRLYIQSGGTLHLRAGATIEITGTSPDQHGIWGENATNVNIIMEGSDGMPSTTLAAGTYNEKTTSLPVTSAANFAVGEWISVFDNQSSYTGTTEYYDANFTDEGFWIHDISGNTLYFRHYTGPEDVTVEDYSGTTLRVSNAKKFRPTQQIIFGTGSNRNIKTISSINYGNNELTIDSSVTGTATGEYVYLTGTEKIHTAGDKVRKVCTVTTAASSLSSNQIVVANANLFSIGDDIWVERRSEADGSTDYAGWYSSSNWKDTRRTISGISGTTITLDEQTPYTVVEGALVTRLSRDVTVKCTTPGTDYGFLYMEQYTSNWDRNLILKDVYFKDFGNDDANQYTGVTLRGYHSTDNLPVTLTEQVPSRSRGAWVEGLMVHVWPDSTHQRDWGPLWSYDLRSTFFRNCLTMHGDDGISYYYEPHGGLFNCIVTGADNYGLRIEGPNGVCEFGYLYASRNYYQYRIYLPYDSGRGVHNVRGDSCHHSLQHPGMHQGALNCRNFMITGTRYGPIDDNSHGFLQYSSHRFLSGLPNAEAGTGTAMAGSYRAQNARQLAQRPFRIIEDDFEYDKVRLLAYNSESYWDATENAWRFFRRYDSSDNPGLVERVYVPAGVSLKARGEVKLAPGFSGTYPILTITSEQLGPYNNPLTVGADSRFANYRVDSAFTASAASDYESKSVTLAAINYPRTLIVGVFSSNSNAAEGYWVKPTKILLSEPYSNPAMNTINNSMSYKSGGIVTEVGTSFDNKTRLGGRLS